MLRAGSSAMEVRKKIPSYATYMLVGSVAFWLPSVILHAVKGDDYFRHLTVLAYVQVFSTLGALVSIWFLRGWIVPPSKNRALDPPRNLDAGSVLALR